MGTGLGFLWGKMAVLRSGPWHILVQLQIKCQALQKAILSIVKRDTRLEWQMGAIQVLLELPLSDAQSKFDKERKGFKANTKIGDGFGIFLEWKLTGKKVYS